jgi:8-oxo-dGTP diphosphatase
MKPTDHPWVGVDNIIQNEEGKIILIKRSKESVTYPDFWGLVGGFIDWGETVEQALKREAMEEVGVEIEVIKFCGRYYDGPERSPDRTIIALPHLCRIVKGEPKANQPEEIQEVRWFKPAEIREINLAYDHKQMLIDEGLI